MVDRLCNILNVKNKIQLNKKFVLKEIKNLKKMFCFIKYNVFIIWKTIHIKKINLKKNYFIILITFIKYDI